MFRHSAFFYAGSIYNMNLTMDKNRGGRKLQQNRIEKKSAPEHPLLSKLNSSPPCFYSLLSAEHQALFSGCEWAKNIPSGFEDGTHQLWACQFDSEKRFLKLSSTSNGEPSAFWQAVEGVFEFELASSLGQYARVYQSIATWSPLVIPKLLHSASSQDALEEGGIQGELSLLKRGCSGVKFSGFLLTEYLEGQGLTAERLTLNQVAKIAEHVALLHQHSAPCFGALFEESMASSHKTKMRWKRNLKQTLLMLNKTPTVPVETMERTVALVDELNINGFQPIMLDFRWDQFLQLEGGRNLALLDLDAMVWAPRELELVMLEYVLTPKQAEVFLSVYTPYHALPDLTLARLVYRVLLFQMNVLGVWDFNRWMAHPERF